MTDQLTAVNAFIFGGSATFGVEQAGFKVDRVLELIDEMDQHNGYHFAKNRPDVPMIPPSTWETGDYLKSGMPPGLDYMFCNCPCSGLSRINRNASADSKTNVHFYRLFEMFKHAKPKAFTIENAPTLVTLGYPIIKDLIQNTGLADDYNFTILVDEAGRHGVAMKRQRTMLLGWRRDFFDDKIPLIRPLRQDPVFVKDVIGDLSESLNGSNIPNHNELTQVDFAEELPEALEIAVRDHCSHLRAMCKLIKEKPEVLDRLDEKKRRYITREAEKLDNGTLKWDKTAAPLNWNRIAPSMTSLTRLIHPSGKRQVSVREMSRFMGYPDDFIFHEGGKTHIVQCLAQGVPAPFVKWVAGEAKRNLLKEDVVYLGDRRKGDVAVFQHHLRDKYVALKPDDFDKIQELRPEYFGDRTVKIPKGCEVDSLFT